MSISSVPGFDALSATLTPRTYAGSDVLSVPVTPSVAPATPSATTTPPASTPATTTPPVNPYLAAYDQIKTASSVALMQSLSAGTTDALSNLSERDGPTNSLSGISSMMDALKAGIAEGMFGGTGFDILV